jgi:hypothetical protein
MFPNFAEIFVIGLNKKFADESQFAAKYFSFQPGRKYDRIVAESSSGGQHSYAFVEKATGFVFKAAGWSAPAKGVRYQTIEAALEASDLYGSFLYIRG